MDMVRFERKLDQSFLELLSKDGPLNFIIKDCLEHTDPDAFDIQIREKSNLMIYHGNTCVMKLHNKNSDSTKIEISAHNAYGQAGRKCSATYKQVMRSWNSSDLDQVYDLKRLFKNYLATIPASVNARYYKNEGLWANRLCSYFGSRWDKTKDWLIIDRESVIGFDTAANKSAFAQYKKVYKTIEQTFRAGNPKKWGRPDLQKSFGDELDMLAIGPNKELICIELKHGSYTSGIYWGPLQASVYKDAFEFYIAELYQGIVDMVKQKTEIGLLPASAKDRIPSNGFSGVQSVLAIAEPNLRSTCWSKMQEVRSKLKNPIQVVQIDSQFGTAYI
ncbi:MAG: hypothetical protein ABFD12_09955 [Syntrophorhabdus sp.]